MGFSETDSSKCTRHPNHRQSPGVCSSCLREKLSKLSTSPSSFNRNKTNYIVSHSSSLSSSASSSTTTATVRTTATLKSSGSRHRRNGSEAYVSVGMMLNNGLKKSRSVSCANLSSSSKLRGNEIVNDKFKSCVNGGGEVEDGCISLKKKNGFLKKLINTTSKKTKGVLMHSKTMKERSHSSSTNLSVTIKN